MSDNLAKEKTRITSYQQWEKQRKRQSQRTPITKTRINNINKLNGEMKFEIDKEKEDEFIIYENESKNKGIENIKEEKENIDIKNEEIKDNKNNKKDVEEKKLIENKEKQI